MSRFDRLTLLLTCLCLLIAVVATKAQSNQYLLLYNLYVFEYREEAPFETIRPMQWDSVNGFSEISEAPDYLYTLIWLEDGKLRHGYVLRDVSSGDCLFLGMQTDDTLLEPHVAEHQWVTCHETT